MGQPGLDGFNGGDTNLYRYCGNSPTNRSDPTGLLSEAQMQAIRAALEKVIANMSPAQQAEARQELEQIIAAANSTKPKLWRRTDDCGK